MLRSYTILMGCITFMILQISPQLAVSRSERDNTRYVSDVLVINIKDRLEKPYEVVATVQSDDPVLVLEESGNYLKVETADGKQGWIAKQYLKNDFPKSLLIKQLKQEVADLKSQIALKSFSPAETTAGDKATNVSLCQELQQKLNDAEKVIIQLQDEQKTLQTRTSSSGVDESPVTTEQLEQTPENYALLISEYDKRGKLISDLQKTVSKKEDQTRFLWFGAGAIVFLIGILVGKTGNRKKTKLMY